MATQTTTTPSGPHDETILSWRSRMGYSQRDAAQTLGCSRTSIAAWEAQPKRTPRYIRLAMAALSLGIKLDDDPSIPTNGDDQ